MIMSIPGLDPSKQSEELSVTKAMSTITMADFL